MANNEKSAIKYSDVTKYQIIYERMKAAYDTYEAESSFNISIFLHI